MQCHIYTLSNGLRIIHLPIYSPMSYCGFAINAGARDEKSDEAGLAHFVEHMLFKGTKRRKSWHILNRMENVGGELNAYTTKEDTFVYSVFMEEHFKRAFELLADLVFNSIFPAIEVEKEREVILDEINSYKDNPSELIFDEFEDILFAGHALGHNILGNENTLKGFGPEAGKSFTECFYTPDNMVFFSMGKTPFRKIVSWTANLSESFPSSKIGMERIPPSPVSPVNKKKVIDSHQAHVIIGSRAFSMYDERRIPQFILNNILGGPGMNSRLNLSLREKHGLAYHVESSITSFTDTGMFTIYFGTDHKHIAKAISLTNKELKRLRENLLSTSQLTAVKRQIIGQLGVSSDNKESLFLGLGKSYLHHNRYDSLEEIFQKIEKVTASQLLEVANELFSEDQLSSLVYE